MYRYMRGNTYQLSASATTQQDLRSTRRLRWCCEVASPSDLSPTDRDTDPTWTPCPSAWGQPTGGCSVTLPLRRTWSQSDTWRNQTTLDRFNWYLISDLPTSQPMRCGVVELAFEPEPSCPYELAPQEYTAPSSERASEWAYLEKKRRKRYTN